MNIVFLLRYWPILGGCETVTRLLANKFVDLGYGVSIIFLWEKKQADMPFIDERINQVKIKGTSEPDENHTISKSDYSLLKNCLHEYIADNKVDIIINQWWPAKLVFEAIKKTNTRLICCCHTNVYQNLIIRTFKQKIFYTVFGEWGHRFRLKSRLKDYFYCSDKLVLLATSFIEESKKLFNVKEVDKKVCAIQNPLVYADFIKTSELKNKKKELLFVGRIDEQGKRITYLLESWKSLQDDEAAYGWRFVIVGNGKDVAYLKEYAMQLGCRNISFEGQQNPLSYYQRASIFISASPNEGWGMTLVEAQQNGCVPVVMDSYSSLHEIIHHNANGLIVKNNDIPAFTASIKLLISDDNMRIRLACNGIETCKRFSIDNISSQWEKLFQELMI
jgi:glycosyltransferase involved in cell wall biosynthesis